MYLDVTFLDSPVSPDFMKITCAATSVLWWDQEVFLNYCCNDGSDYFFGAKTAS